MNDRLAELLIAIVGYVTEHDGYITKTKLLKLVYLLDVEFYRAHGSIFTGFQWKYLHLGPWTKEFDPLLDQLLVAGDITDRAHARPDYDTRFLQAGAHVDLRKPFDSYKDEAILKTILDIWGPCATGEILDYVYFRTEPMEYGVRNEDLDFSRVLPQLPAMYKRPASADARELSRMRKAFSERIASRLSNPEFTFTQPRYDEEFRAALEKLDNGKV